MLVRRHIMYRFKLGEFRQIYSNKYAIIFLMVNYGVALLAGI